MNRYPFHAKSLGQSAANRQATELETMDTVLFASGTTRFNPNLSRAIVLLTLSLMSVSALSRAEDATKADAPTGAKAKTAKAKKAAKTADAPGPALIAAKRQDAQPPTTPPTTPDATKPATPPTVAPTPAAAAAPTPPAPGTVTYSGLIDVYYGINTRAPRAANNGPFGGATGPDGTHVSIDNVGRAFDINDRDPSLSLAELNVVRTHNKSLPIDITATLTFGETARLVHITEPGGTAAWQFLQQLYATYTPHVLGRDIAIDFGKFVTPFGLEVIESVNNDNYSRGFNFQFGVPLYHAGLRATAPIDTKGQFTVQAGIVNGWNNVADDNNGKSVYGQLVWKPTPKLTGIFGVLGGPEGTGAGYPVLKQDGNINTNLYDAQAIYQMDAKTKFAANVTYGAASGDATGVHYSDNWLGLVGYARHQFTPTIAGAIRIEQFEDNNGTLRTFTPGYERLREITLTGEYATLRGRLIARLEYRHDHASLPVFGTGSGDVTSDQDTLTLSGVYKF